MKTLTVNLVKSASELAVAEVLSQTLETTIIALMAAHPGLFCDPGPPWVRTPQTSRIAQRIVKRAQQLLDSLADYQRAIDLELARQREDDSVTDDEIPF
jgi:hypothetical protein